MILVVVIVLLLLYVSSTLDCKQTTSNLMVFNSSLSFSFPSAVAVKSSFGALLSRSKYTRPFGVSVSSCLPLWIRFRFVILRA